MERGWCQCRGPTEEVAAATREMTAAWTSETVEENKPWKGKGAKLRGSVTAWRSVRAGALGTAAGLCAGRCSIHRDRGGRSGGRQHDFHMHVSMRWSLGHVALAISGPPEPHQGLEELSSTRGPASQMPHLQNATGFVCQNSRLKHT